MEEGKRLDLEPNFYLIVNTFVTQALISLGAVKNPFTKKEETNLEHARFCIDLLNVLQRKTRGNLSSEEEKYLDDVLSDLRIRYVKLADSSREDKEET